MRDAGDGLESPRLALRRFRPDDLDLLDRLNRDPVVMRYLGGPASRTETETLLRERILDYYTQHPGLGVWATLEKASGACIGFHLLNHVRGEPHIQVGYRLFSDHWGRGYATEMSRALLRYGYQDRGLAQIVAFTHLDNGASQRVLLKSGLRRQADRSLADPWYASFGPIAWFERDARDWLADDRA